MDRRTPEQYRLVIAGLEKELADYRKALDKIGIEYRETKKYLDATLDELKENKATILDLKCLLKEIGCYVVKPSTCDCDDCNSAYYEMVNKVKKVLEEDEPKRKLGRWGHR